ncbi:F-box protein [Legionella sp.]|uniref:F-box protein n=1 Tax=Legionella sp. TaxID=459 RepID=UPI00321FBDAA
MHDRTEKKSIENGLLSLPWEMVFLIFDNMPLSSVINLRGVSNGLKDIVEKYLELELKIKQLACGQNHTLVLLAKGRVLATGSNKHGQLGVPGGDCFSFTELTGIDRIEAIGAGFSHSLLLSKEKKKVWIMGDNSKGQLTLTTEATTEIKSDNPEEAQTETENTSKPVMLQEVADLKKIKAITTVDFTTAVLTDAGEVKTAGKDSLKPRLINNQLRLLPDWITLPEDLDIIDVSFGMSHALLLTAEGVVYGKGSNELGLLGLANIESCPDWTKLCDYKVSKIKATSLGSLLLTADHKLMVSGINSSKQFGNLEELIPGFEEIAASVTDFDANDSHTIYLDASHRLYGMGSNDLGQLGTGKPRAQGTSVPAPVIPVKQLTVSQFRTPKMNPQAFFQFESQSNSIAAVGWKAIKDMDENWDREPSHCKSFP